MTMTRARRPLALAALLLAAAPAAAAPAPCITGREMSAMIATISPAVVAELAGQCRAYLPAGAYLLRPDLAARFTPLAAAARPAARAAFEKMAGQKLPASLRDDTVTDLIVAGVRERLFGKPLKPAGCGGVNRALAILDPLPPQNMIDLLALTVELGARGKVAELRLCPAG